MDTRALQLFLTLSESLSFTRTAEQRHMSLSAVSRSLQRMEAELGQRLLERDKRSVRLTPAGEKFADYARKSLAQWQGLLGEFRPDADDLRGEIRVYCSVTASYSVLSPILERFRSEYPGIEIIDPIREVHQALVLGTRDYLQKNNFDKVLIGLSGGIDSSLVAAIAVDAPSTATANPMLYR